VKVLLLPSAVAASDGEPEQLLTTYLLNDAVAVDAGSLGFYPPAWTRHRIRHVLLSHTHFDHCASLPVFLENVYDGSADCVTVHGSADVLDTLRQDVFNDRVWPDLLRLAPPEAPFVRFSLLEPLRPVTVEGLQLTPVPVHHTVPTFAFLVQSPTTAVLLVSDTGPTEQVWEVANRTADLRAVFLEASFPDELAWLAEAAQHLTPARFAAEVAKLRRPVPLYAVHLKPRYQQQIAAQLQALGVPQLHIARPGQPYQFE
jgi:ribonuclease BN (tRNA processing enzyme)